jgi:hypothetical protein
MAIIGVRGPMMENSQMSGVASISIRLVK